MAQLYAKIFTKILDSSIAEDWKMRLVFMDMLMLADDGVVDMTHSAISRRTSVPIDIVRESIAKLESPDPASSNATHEGRRIIRLDSHRDWGWQIVNWDFYSSLRTREDAKSAAANKKRKYRKVDDEQQGTLPIEGVSPHTPLKEDYTRLDYAHQGLSVDSDGTQRGLGGDSTGTQGGLGHGSLKDQAEAIWKLYPKKVAKPDGIAAIRKALKQFRFDDLLKQTAAFAAFVSTWDAEDFRFIPYPSTWFNQQRFNDDPRGWDTRRSVAQVTPQPLRLPLWQQIKILKEQIAGHDANPDYAGYLPERVTPEMAKDYADKCDRLEALEASGAIEA